MADSLCLSCRHHICSRCTVYPVQFDHVVECVSWEVRPGKIQDDAHFLEVVEALDRKEGTR